MFKDFERIYHALTATEKWLEENKDMLKNEYFMRSLSEAKKDYEFGFAHAHNIEQKYSRFINANRFGNKIKKDYTILYRKN